MQLGKSQKVLPLICSLSQYYSIGHTKILRRVHTEGNRERRMRATEAGSARRCLVMAPLASAAGCPGFHPQGHLLIALLGAGAISSSELCTVVKASLKLWAVSREVGRVATSCNTAPETIGEGKVNRHLEVTLDFVTGHIFH